jgi:twinkle protein
MRTTLRVLKDRYTGQATGQTIELSYDYKTGLLQEAQHTDSMFSPTTEEMDF